MTEALNLQGLQTLLEVVMAVASHIGADMRSCLFACFAPDKASAALQNAANAEVIHRTAFFTCDMGSPVS